MKEFPFQTRMEVLDLYLQGLSGDKVSESTGVSKGTVISIIKDAREGKYPQLELKGRIDELHNTATRLRKQSLDLTQTRLGFGFLQRLLGLGVELDRLEEWIGFCSEISPTSPEGFVPAAMELFRVKKETGVSYSELASQVRELAGERQRLTAAVADLKAREKKSIELKTTIGENEKRLDELTAKRSKLQAEVDSLDTFIRRQAKSLDIPPEELQTRLAEVINLDAEISSKRNEHNRLHGEVKALNEQHQRLSSQMGKASADFERDIELIKQIRQEVAAIAEMKGRYEKEIEHLEWAVRVLPFLSDPDKVSDPDFDLIAIVINCIDKWIHLQPQWRFGAFSLRWDEVKRYVEKQRT